MKSRTKLAVAALAALPAPFVIAAPASARVDPTFDSSPRYTVEQSPEWETLAGGAMRGVLHVPGYGWVRGFCVAAGNRYDAGTIYGFPAGNAEARVEVYADGPGGLCTEPVPATRLTVNVTPVYVDPESGVHSLADQGCWGSLSVTNAPYLTANAGGVACAAPTSGGPHPNYLTGGYAVAMSADGLMYFDQPASAFHVEWVSPQARRI